MDCPRCLSPGCAVVARAPDGSGAWEMHFCPNCDFAWRNTEEPEVIDRALRDPWFNLDAEEIESMPTLAPIPPLRREGR